jgi:hypothetical protein
LTAPAALADPLVVHRFTFRAMHAGAPLPDAARGESTTL